MLPVSKNIRFGGLIIFIATIAIFTVFHAFGFDRAVIDWARRISLGEPATALPVDVKLRTVFADMPGNRLFGLIDIEDLLALGFFSTAGILAFSVLQNIRLKRTLLAKQQTERANRLLALFDPLTELPNRRNFEDYGANYLKDRSDHERRAIFLIDLDHFKPVNDLYGHAAGDTVLSFHASAVTNSLLSQTLSTRPPTSSISPGFVSGQR
jgi:predicted signal transduction protein with EAL and GGDEF domain